MLFGTVLNGAEMVENDAPNESNGGVILQNNGVI
jgi:hypothetical protein